MTQILVVDDSPIDRNLVKKFLRKDSDWEIREAENGVEALEYLQSAPADIVLTDLQMPEMDGLELVQEMRTAFSSIPVVLMTAKGSEEIAVRALQQGATSYVPKRRLSTDIVETIRRVLQGIDEQQTHAVLMDRLVHTQSEFVAENNMPILLSLANFLQQSLGTFWGCTLSDRMRIGTALEEALSNAMLHGNLELGTELRESDHEAYCQLAEERYYQEPYSNRRVHVLSELTPHEARFTIRDEGAGFDHSELPDADVPENLSLGGGRGVMIMKTFMDEVIFNDAGNSVTLIKRAESSLGNNE